jgi:putative oxidoreductase
MSLNHSIENTRATSEQLSGGRGRDAVLLAGRVVIGGYLALHGAQILFGAFGGDGLERAGAGFEEMGMTPGRGLAFLAGLSDLAGGVLTATGIGDPLGPLVIAGAMVVASAVHRSEGPLSTNRAIELPLSDLAGALTLAAAGAGRYRLGPKISPRLTRIAAGGGAGAATVMVAKLLRSKPTSRRPQIPTNQRNTESV